MTSVLAYQWLFLRLSKRFTLPFAAAAAGYLFFAFPRLYTLLEPLLGRPAFVPASLWGALGLPLVLPALLVLALLALGLGVALWTATAVYRLAPPRPVAWMRAAGVEEAPGAHPAVSPTRPAPAEPLGRFQRIGIILAGGGAKGAYQAGALAAVHRFLVERRALGSVRMIAGTSIGAWNACFWLADLVGGEQPTACETWWHRVRLSEVVAPTYYLPGWRNYALSDAPWREAFRALFADDPAVRARLQRHMDVPDAARSLHFYLTRTNVRRAHLEFSTNRRDLTGIENVSGRRRPLVPPDRWLRAATIDDLEKAVFASMDLPPLFEYVRFGDELFEDGGVVDNLPIYFGTGIERCDLLFVLPLNASFAGEVDLRSMVLRMSRLLTIRQGALERKALKDVYLYNELAALRDRPGAGSAARPESLVDGPAAAAPAYSEAALREAASRSLTERAAGRAHLPVQIFAVAPDEPLFLDTVEFWKTAEAGRAYRLMEEYTRYELERFDFEEEPNWIRVALIGPQGEVRYLEDF